MKLLYACTALLFFCSCTGSGKNAAAGKNMTTSEAVQVQSDKSMLQTGVEFYASGNTPAGWSLEMDYDAKINFKADDGIVVNTDYNRFKKTADATKTTYTATVAAGEMKILLETGSCSLPAKKMEFTKLVSITLNGKVYTGCGRYTKNYDMNGKWQLEKIGNTNIVAAEYNKVPTLQFDLAANRMSGNDGCNSIGGNIEVQGSRIAFSGIISTRMACMKKDISQLIGRMSNNTSDYYFKEGKLYLYLPDDSLLVFTKVN